MITTVIPGIISVKFFIMFSCLVTGRVTDDPSQTPGLGYAPPYDHTTGTPYGHYLYFYDSIEDAETATVVSEMVSVSRDSCFSFWVHMFGDRVSELPLPVKMSGNLVFISVDGRIHNDVNADDTSETQDSHTTCYSRLAHCSSRA